MLYIPDFVSQLWRKIRGKAWKDLARDTVAPWRHAVLEVWCKYGVTSRCRCITCQILPGFTSDFSPKLRDKIRNVKPGFEAIFLPFPSQLTTAHWTRVHCTLSYLQPYTSLTLCCWSSFLPHPPPTSLSLSDVQTPSFSAVVTASMAKKKKCSESAAGSLKLGSQFSFIVC